jgi:hypothetical protein
MVDTFTITRRPRDDIERDFPAGPGLARCRSGRGFRFLDAHGNAVHDADWERIRALAIPPAWREMWICPWPNGHIQAVAGSRLRPRRADTVTAGELALRHGIGRPARRTHRHGRFPFLAG